MHCFVQPLDKPSYQGLLRPSELRKRKRPIDDYDDDDGDIADDLSFLPTRTSNQSYLAKPSLHPDLAHQYERAGQPYDQDPPGRDFPHRPIPDGRDAANHLSLAELKGELASLKPPLIHDADLQDGHSTTLKRHHLAVLTTIMHHCLLQGDYIRAGRAWGMILRTEVSGTRPNIQSHGLWGIGAEILLQAEGQAARIRAGQLAKVTLHSQGESSRTAISRQSATSPS